MLGAVVLAAGSATRMGLRPKCLLELDGVSLIKRIISDLKEAGVDEIVVISGHYAGQIEPEIATLAVTLIRNPSPDDGHTSSLRLGLTALSRKIDHIIVALSDQPLINSEDIRQLTIAYEKRPTDKELVVPIVHGQPGNPVMFSARVCREILDGASDFGGKQWRIANQEKVHRWVSVNENYLTDVDSPEDIEALRTKTGLQLSWPRSFLKTE